MGSITLTNHLYSLRTKVNTIHNKHAGRKHTGRVEGMANETNTIFFLDTGVEVSRSKNQFISFRTEVEGIQNQPGVNNTPAHCSEGGG